MHQSRRWYVAFSSALFCKVLKVLHSRRLLASREMPLHSGTSLGGTRGSSIDTGGDDMREREGDALAGCSLISSASQREEQVEAEQQNQLFFPSQQRKKNVEDDVHVHSIEVWVRAEEELQVTLEGEDRGGRVSVQSGRGHSDESMRKPEERRSTGSFPLHRSPAKEGGTTRAFPSSESLSPYVPEGPASSHTLGCTTTDGGAQSTTASSVPSPTELRPSQASPLSHSSTPGSFGTSPDSGATATKAATALRNGWSSSSSGCPESSRPVALPCRCCASSCACFSASLSPWRLCAGEIGVRIGGVYTSLTGFSEVNEAGNVQMACLGILLKSIGMYGPGFISDRRRKPLIEACR